MNIYKVTFNHGQEQFIVASSYGEAELLWLEERDNYIIDSIDLVASDVMLSKSLTHRY